MLLTSLSLQNFRKFGSLQLKFDPQTTVLVGDNASGKTSIAEAINLVSTGNSFRATKVDQMIKFDQELGRVTTLLQDDHDDTNQLEVILTRGMVQNKKTAKRLYSLNDVKKRKKDVIGKFQVVLFRPEDMRLVEGSPSRRRQFLDVALTSVSQDYGWSLATYEQALKRRNKLLEQVREKQAPQTSLRYWDQQLIKHGQILQAQRSELLQSFKTVDFPLDFSITYQKSLLSEERMEQYQSRSIAAGHTLIGPHKDDFIVSLSSKPNQLFDIALYGSRGQQRMAVLWLKICELAFIESKCQTKPILLLDDILSELDRQMKQKVIKLMNAFQTIITTADKGIPKEIKKTTGSLTLIELESES